VQVQGDRVGYTRYWLRIPEEFQRQFSEQRNLPDFINDLCFTIGFGVFGGFAALAAILGLLRGVLNWRVALMPVLLVGVVTLLARLNDLPSYKFYYGTTSDYTLFWLNNISSAVIAAFYNALFVLILWLGGIALSKKAWPRQDKIIPRGQDRRIGLAKSTYRGLMLGGLQAGYVTLFYLLAVQLFGGWVPLSPPTGASLASPLPFMGSIYVGLIPATQEELLFRLIGIALVLLLGKRRWLAILIPAALWGFAHLSYVRDPFYFRGLELTIVGVMYGLFFLRFGLITTIVAHYTWNAGLGALPLLRSGEPWYVLSGLVILATMLAPIVPGVIRWFRMRRHLDPLRGAPAPHMTMATASDLSGLQALAIEDTDWSSWLDDPTRVTMCLKSDGKIIGAVMGCVLDDETVDITLVYIAPDWRRHYWGATLIDQFKIIARNGGVHDLQSTVDVKDDTGVAFWASQGWRPWHRVYSFKLVEEARPRPKRWWKRMGLKLEKRFEFLM
jgi:membrane protease YdiL (CAAX protease family)